MTDRSAIRALAAELLARFEAAGATRIETDILQPADTLLDLYGEDIRARAFTTHDPLAGELMLRPDFTVPVVQAHMADGAEPARYAYAGKVFRRQEEDTGRPNEHIQVGFELFDRSDAARADAEVFALIAAALAGSGLRPVTADIGILRAAVKGLETTEARKNALMRHIWRPARFSRLLARFGGRTPPPPSRARLLGLDDPLATGAPEIGLRGLGEIEERIAALREDSATPPISGQEIDLLDDLLSIRAQSPEALERLRDLAVDMPALGPAVERFARRLDALGHAGIDVAELDFEAAFGRDAMEYYDGFLFGFMVPSMPDLPPVASGGRYDALTARLGGGRAIPAVGAVIRPGLLLEYGGRG